MIFESIAFGISVKTVCEVGGSVLVFVATKYWWGSGKDEPKQPKVETKQATPAMRKLGRDLIAESLTTTLELAVKEKIISENQKNKIKTQVQLNPEDTLENVFYDVKDFFTKKDSNFDNNGKLFHIFLMQLRFARKQKNKEGFEILKKKLFSFKALINHEDSEYINHNTQHYVDLSAKAELIFSKELLVEYQARFGIDAAKVKPRRRNNPPCFI